MKSEEGGRKVTEKHLHRRIYLFLRESFAFITSTRICGKDNNVQLLKHFEMIATFVILQRS